MILGRSKKKSKKAQKLQEAQQQTFLASLQQQQQQQQQRGGGGGGVYGSSLPTGISEHSIGIYEKEEEYQDGSSGSDPDAEMLDSLSLGSVHQHMIKSPHDAAGHEYSPPSQQHANTLPPQLSTHAQQQQFTFSTANPTPATTREHSFRRGISQPMFASIPTNVPEGVSAPSPSHAVHQAAPHFQQSHIRQKSNGIGSPKKIREHKRITHLNPELVATALSFGLGRGIDATDKTPWLNKKSCQVRRVHSSVIETNEGGILVNYDHEVQSFADSEENFLGSLHPPESAVTIHIEDELDRNVSSTRRIVGRRVINRSICFQTDFEEKYADGEMAKLTKDSILIPKDPAEVVHNTQMSGYTFEERVCQWLLHRLVQKFNLPLHKLDESPVDHLAKVIHSKPAHNIDGEIRAGCQELVQGLKITHYITGMQLGAIEYRIMSEGQYHKRMGLEGAFGVDKLAAVLSTQQTKLSRRESKKCSQLRQIGKIENNYVAKGTKDEAVLQVRVQPITRLIKLPILKSAFTAALEKYMEGTPSSEGGPFVIKCTGRNLYLTVNKFNNYEVEGTDIPTEASLFYFQTTDDGGNPFEFHIAYYGEDADPNDQTTEASSIGRYLEAPLNPQGRCPGPLLMNHSVKVKNTRFTLRSRLSKKNNKSHLAEWIAGEDAFYIACATKKYQHGSYLAVKSISNAGDLIGKHFHMTCCDPSIHNHNGENSFMLFQLCSKESIMNKASGRETPGKLPLTSNKTTEVITRNEKKMANNDALIILQA